jgi:hypothetical protein
MRQASNSWPRRHAASQLDATQVAVESGVFGFSYVGRRSKLAMLIGIRPELAPGLECKV